MIAEARTADLEARRLENLENLFWDSHRPFVPISETFLQIRGEPPRPGRLGDLIRGRNRQALDLFLLLHVASSSPPPRLSVDPYFWAVILRRPSQTLRNARLALYRSLETLEALGLLKRETKLGVPRILLLDERGSGEEYVHPFHRGERYFTLPHSYWTQGLDRELQLPGKAVLLLARSFRPGGFTLPLAHSQDWYGISTDTLRRGIRELVKLGLVRYQTHSVLSTHAPRGTTIRRTYKLVGTMARMSPGFAPTA